MYKRDAFNLRQKAVDARQRVYDAQEALNRLPANADDDLVVAADTALTAAQDAAERASERYEAFLEDEGPGRDR